VSKSFYIFSILSGALFIAAIVSLVQSDPEPRPIRHNDRPTTTGSPRKAANAGKSGPVSKRRTDPPRATEAPAVEPHPTADEEPLPREDPEVRRQRVYAEWDTALQLHEREPVASAWAFEAESHFAADATSIAESLQASVLRTDCRSTTCAVEVSFDSYNHAVNGFSAFLHHPYAENCERESILPPPQDPADPYVATVLFRCGET